MTISADRPLQLDIRREEKHIVISAHGCADVMDAPELQHRLQSLTDLPDQIIVLDLSDLDFIGPDGLDALLLVRRSLVEHHGQIRLVNPNPGIRRMLEISRLTEILPIYDSLEQATV